MVGVVLGCWFLVEMATGVKRGGFLRHAGFCRRKKCWLDFDDTLINFF